MEALVERKQVMGLFNALPDDKIGYVLRVVQNLSKQEVTPSYPADSLEAEAEHRAQVEAAFKETAGMWSGKDPPARQGAAGARRTPHPLPAPPRAA